MEPPVGIEPTHRRYKLRRLPLHHGGIKCPIIVLIGHMKNIKQKIFELHGQGLSTRKIGKIVGLGKTTVWCYLFPEKSLELQRKRRKNFKTQLVNLCGGKCELCGYNKTLSSLDFHHIDKNTKKFGISNGYYHSKAKEEILKEVKKCVLLCSNCHHEVHDGIASIEKLAAPRGIEPTI